MLKLVARSPREVMEAEGIRPFPYRERMVRAGRRHVFVGGLPRVVTIAKIHNPRNDNARP